MLFFPNLFYTILLYNPRKIGEYNIFMKKNKNHIRWGLTAFFVILASLVSYYIIFHLDNFKGILSKLIVILMPVIDGM